MRCFSNIAKLIREKRLGHPKGYSQSELSNLLGYKNGQFISNVERGLCNIPLKMLSRVSEILNIRPDELREAILMDQDKTIRNYLQMSPQRPNSPVRVEREEANNVERLETTPLHLRELKSVNG